jgi:hypothetical protein
MEHPALQAELCNLKTGEQQSDQLLSQLYRRARHV